jgi:hypothetical protein
MRYISTYLTGKILDPWLQDLEKVDLAVDFDLEVKIVFCRPLTNPRKTS